MTNFQQLWSLAFPFMSLLFVLFALVCLETGLNESNRPTRLVFLDILTRNLLVTATAAIVYVLLGFDLMYPGDTGFWWVSYFGNEPDPLILGGSGPLFPGISLWEDIATQTTFAVTATLLFAAMMALYCPRGLVLLACPVFTLGNYVVFGRWHWGGGWLSNLGFIDHWGALSICGTAAGAACGIALSFGKPAPPMSGFRGLPSKGRSVALGGAATFYIVFPLLAWILSGWIFGVHIGDLATVPALYAAATVFGLFGARSALRFLDRTWPRSVHPSAVGIMGAIAAATASEAGIETFGLWWVVAIGLLAGVASVPMWIFLHHHGWRDPVCGLSAFGLGGLLGTVAAHSGDYYQPGVQSIGAAVGIAGPAIFWFAAGKMIRSFSKLPPPPPSS